MWDLAEAADSIRLIKHFAARGRPLAAVCHAPAILRHPKGVDGRPLVTGRNVTGFSTSDEAALGLPDVVPCLIEDMLVANGGVHSSSADRAPHVVVEEHLVTRQNPASSNAAAKALLPLLGQASAGRCRHCRTTGHLRCRTRKSGARSCQPFRRTRTTATVTWRNPDDHPDHLPS